MQYSEELKNALLRRMLPPNNESITKISREEGISEQTLRNWRDKARADGIPVHSKVFVCRKAMPLFGLRFYQNTTHLIPATPT